MTENDMEAIAPLLERGIALEQRQNFDDAIALYQEALSIAPLASEAWFRMGACLRRAGMAENAVRYLEKATMLAPERPEYELERGDALFILRRLEEALQAYLRVEELEPDNISAINNTGVVLQEAGLPGEAVNALRRTIEIAPEDAHLRTNFGAALIKAGQIPEALQNLEMALKLDASIAETWSNYAFALQESLLLDDALSAHEKALEIAPENPSLHYNYAMTLLLAGRFKAGFAEFEYRTEMPDRRPREFSAPRWNGEDPTGKTILVHAEQGIGDAIQFARFLPHLRGQGAKLILAAHTSTVEIMRTLEGVDQVVSGSDIPVSFDYQIPLLSLAHYLDPELKSLDRKSGPYLRVPDGALSPLSGPNSRTRIGLVWAGNPNHANDHNRSCHLDEFAPLIMEERFEWVSLQVGAAAGETQNFDGQLVDISQELTDFGVTAAAISALDLIGPHEVVQLVS